MTNRIPVRIRTFRKPDMQPINHKIDYISWVTYEGEKFPLCQAYDSKGNHVQNVPWSLRQAEQLVETGHWIMEDTCPRNDDQPDLSYGVEAW